MTDAARQRQILADALLRAGAEDRDAFAEVYRLTSAKLYGICLRICGEAGAAEDVLHEVYLLIWKRAGAFDPGRASPITWLATIARNRAIDWRRAHPPVATAPLSDLAALPDAAPLAPDLLIEAEGHRALHACLDELEARQRDAIRTAYFNGVTYAELAARAAVPLGTMKSLIRRALAKLRECLGDA